MNQFLLTVVTTASEEGFKVYGRRFLESFTQYWPGEVRLIFYVESAPLAAQIALDHQRAELRDLKQSTWLSRFKETWHNDGRANGRGGYQWNAIRFAHKVAAIIAADQIVSSDYLLWLDADIVTHQPVDETAIWSWLPSNDFWLSWLERGTKQINYPECGFLAFNRLYSKHRMALMAMTDLYTSGRVLQLPETHDSYVWKWLVENLSLPARNLSGPGYMTLHPLINSPLGKWFDHLKGSRKLVGRSYKSDLVVARPEEYWKRSL